MVQLSFSHVRRLLYTASGLAALGTKRQVSEEGRIVCNPLESPSLLRIENLSRLRPPPRIDIAVPPFARPEIVSFSSASFFAAFFSARLHRARSLYAVDSVPDIRRSLVPSLPGPAIARLQHSSVGLDRPRVLTIDAPNARLTSVVSAGP